MKRYPDVLSCTALQARVLHLEGLLAERDRVIMDLERALTDAAINARQSTLI